MAEERRRFLITGKVQGVGFRWWARRTAQRLGVRGRVRNLPDGSVEVEAAAGPEALSDLETALHKGPLGASVAGVRRLDPNEDALPADFEIAG